MGLKMLLVDDEPLARSRMRTLLADCKSPAAEVAGEAANAAQAMEQLRRQAFDGVLLDIHMPGADGLALAAMTGTRSNFSKGPTKPARCSACMSSTVGADVNSTTTSLTGSCFSRPAVAAFGSAKAPRRRVARTPARLRTA